MKRKTSIPLLIIVAALIVLAILAFNSENDMLGRVRGVSPANGLERAYFGNYDFYV